MTHYYTRRDKGELNGPFPSYSTAMDDHTAVLMRIPPGAPKPGHLQTFVDLATVVANESTMLEMLHDNPVLAAIFTTGRRMGRDETERRARTT